MLTKKDKENLEFFYNYLKNQGFKDFDKKDKLQSLKKLINTPVETTNEQPKKKSKKKCNNPSGLCTCSLGYPCKKG